MKTFEFDVAIGSSSTADYPVKTVKFGEGYEQRQPQSLAPILEKWSVSATGTKKHIDKIKAFLDEHAGYKAFLWRVTPDESYKKYKAKGYRRMPKGGGVWELQWEMEEVLA
ncbi:MULTISPECIES: phage tail protein [Pasteurellaceae]|uniref:Phage tail protein n=1 Tax=Pasteurella atlantica TaxID=2827233 RepID=A0AAW8CFH6_9PAST|nr:phage tail protein [Pasteurella atlantica]MBR0573680.1 phage tail protein [Pasteurella atlantica]MDP8039687.1 phage tail protein [Pasteurella atlantica]MDP8041778.1 phage tail protein [Pasteurella atlantica]MDP8043948.1 phage tail protein [Pasteurella atlantica]MDP8045926.1 phage tail protein [Pasteurella atlantica]